MMKLRLRPFQSKETLKIQVPNSCTLPQFRQILYETLPNSPSPASIRLSLNRKDELQSDAAEDTLQSLGVAAGDLIYFSVEDPNSQIALPQATDSTPTPRSNDTESSTSLNPQNTLPGVENSNSVMSDSQKRKNLGVDSQAEVETVSAMEVDDEDIADFDKSFSVPGFLRKVFASELGEDNGCNHKLIVIAVHAVLLESGFVGVDGKANTVVNSFQLCNEWPPGLSSMSLFYTLRESVRKDETPMKFLLKFQSMGKYINVYGQLGKRGIRRVQLNEDELVPFLNVVWANCEGDTVMENVTGQNGGSSPEKEVFKFWRSVKDNLALPLLIDFCEEAGLVLPPCFMRLPTELKLKILESLPGVDVAKVSCVSSELRYLASGDDLWNMKFSEEFGSEGKEGQVSWKKAFSMAWSRRNGRFLASRGRASPYWPMPYWHQPGRRRFPYPLIFERLPPFLSDQPPYGDDVQTMIHDPMNHPLRIEPPYGDDDDLQTMLPLPLPHRMRSFSPQCDLGVRGR
ncbi:hypothetical protein OROHE_007757 [Orobanche hederae]